MSTYALFSDNRQYAIEFVGTLNYAEQMAIIRDQNEAVRSDGITHLEYANRIGAGNLKSYSRCLLLHDSNSDLLPLDRDRDADSIEYWMDANEETK